MGKNEFTPKIVGQWLGLSILFLGVAFLIVQIIIEKWDKTWMGMVVGIIGVIVMLISKKWLN